MNPMCFWVIHSVAARWMGERIPNKQTVNSTVLQFWCSIRLDFYCTGFSHGAQTMNKPQHFPPKCLYHDADFPFNSIIVELSKNITVVKISPNK